MSMSGAVATREKGPQAGELAMAIAENSERCGQLQHRLEQLAQVVLGRQIEEAKIAPEPSAGGLVREMEQIVRRATGSLSRAHDIMTDLEQQLTSQRGDKMDQDPFGDLGAQTLAERG